MPLSSSLFSFDVFLVVKAKGADIHLESRIFNGKKNWPIDTSIMPKQKHVP